MIVCGRLKYRKKHQTSKSKFEIETWQEKETRTTYEISSINKKKFPFYSWWFKCTGNAGNTIDKTGKRERNYYSERNENKNLHFKRELQTGFSMKLLMINFRYFRFVEIIFSMWEGLDCLLNQKYQLFPDSRPVDQKKYFLVA